MPWELLIPVAIIVAVIAVARHMAAEQIKARSRMTPEELAAELEQERKDMQTW